MKFSKTLITSLVLAGISFTQYAHAETVGLVGMFFAEKLTTHQIAMDDLEQEISHQGCTLRREGSILATDGNYEISEMNRFFFLECEQESISKPTTHIWIDKLNKATKNLALFEGNFNLRDASSISQPGDKRSYIIKLSDYNNINPSKRNSDLKQLGEMVQTRKHKYTNEAYVHISAAYGIKRPDEVVLIHYPSNKDGEKFRNNKGNADIMAGIEAFNRDHLTQFSYFVAASNR